MNLPCYQVDAFTRRRFAGNPAAVCPLDAWLPDALMQTIAAENALSETAFVGPDGAPGGLRIRWFTPELEVDLCGHATLAAGFVWLTEREPSRAEVTFASKSGPLTVRRDGDAFTLDFPARPPVVAPPPPGLIAALGLGGAAVREVVSFRGADWIVVLDDAGAVRAAAPDFAALGALHAQVRAAAVTAPGAPGDGGADIVSRFFAPAEGIPEDPVTGSLHCILTPYWTARLGTATLLAHQASRRGGELRCRAVGDRVLLSGHAVLIKTGTLHLEPR